jgi:small-conductance mechanosensitive channel
MELLRERLTEVEGFLDWLPPPVVTLLILTVAIVVALVLHQWLRLIVRRLLAARYPYLFEIVSQTRGLTRLGFVLLAFIVAVPAAPLRPETAAMLSRAVQIGVIAYIGWAAIVAINIAAGLYLRRFRIDVADNLLARKHNTQIRVLLRVADIVLAVLTIGAALMTFSSVRQYGVSLLASAGAAGIIVGLGARPLLSNLFAGIQLAMTQPIRIEDAVIVENEWGWIEEITSTYVVVRLWDLRRMILPLSYFIEKPFQNWTREGSALIGSAFFYVDYAAPVDAIRAKLNEIVKASKNWDGQVAVLQVTDTRERTMELRAIMSARSAGQAFDLRCEVREQLIAFLQQEHPEVLPRTRAEIARLPDNEAPLQPARLDKTGAARSPAR